MELETRYSAGLVILYKGQILLGRTAGRKSERAWGIPKGGIEEGESTIDAAIRETREELGINVNKKLIKPTQYTFAVTSKKYRYNKVVYYYIVEIKDLKQIGLKELIVPKKQLDTSEISESKFFNLLEAKQKVMISQTPVIDNMASKGLLESNNIQQGVGEDDRLLKIRQFKGTIKDYKTYWDDRSNETRN